MEAKKRQRATKTSKDSILPTKIRKPRKAPTLRPRPRARPSGSDTLQLPQTLRPRPRARPSGSDTLQLSTVKGDIKNGLCYS